MPEDDDHVVAFYNRHPISRDQILASLAAQRGQLANIRPEDLFPLDQDHYGGLEAVDALAADTMDAVISQEALLHVPDKRAALAEAYRVLKKGGRLAFTDWIEHRRLDEFDSETIALGTPSGDEEFYRSYARLVALVRTRTLGGGRFTAEK